MKRSNGIEHFKFSIEKVWKMILKMCRRQKVLVMTQVKSIQSFINQSFCEITDSMSTNGKNGMWAEIFNPCTVTIRMSECHSQNC